MTRLGVLPKSASTLLITLEQLSQFDNNNTVFHVTPTANIPSIIRNGLTSQRGNRSQKAEKENGVFCFLNASATILHASPHTGWLLRWHNDAPMSILTVNTTNLKRWNNRPTDHWEWATKDSISASRIKIIGKFSEIM